MYICRIMAHGLDMEIQFLPGVGPKRAELLGKELAVKTVGDLIRLYPFRYIDKSSLVRICDARPDMVYLQVRARVLRVELYGSTKGAPMHVSDGTTNYNGPVYGNGSVNSNGLVNSNGPVYGNGSVNSNGSVYGNGTTYNNGPAYGNGQTGNAQASRKEEAVKFNQVRRMSVWVGDGTGEMEMVFFKGIKWMHGKLTPGAEFIFFGKPTAFNGRINMVHPEVDAPPANTNTSQTSMGGATGRTTGAATGAQTGAQTGAHIGAPIGTSMGGATGGTTGAQIGAQIGASLGASMGTTMGTAMGASMGTTTGSGAGMGTGTMTGVYPSTERLKNAGVTGKASTVITVSNKWRSPSCTYCPIEWRSVVKSTLAGNIPL